MGRGKDVARGGSYGAFVLASNTRGQRCKTTEKMALELHKPPTSMKGVARSTLTGGHPQCPQNARVSCTLLPRNSSCGERSLLQGALSCRCVG